MKNPTRPTYEEIANCLEIFECSHPLDLDHILSDWDKAIPKPSDVCPFVWEWLENNIDSQSYNAT
jgi:hypothetical protein